MSAPAGSRILVVEDEADIASVLQDYLRRDGFDAQCLHDGALALAQIRHAPPALVVLDIMLPGLSGLDLLRALRSGPPALSELPVVLVTARVEELDRLLGLELGADDYLCKPFSPRELVARVKAVLRRSRARPLPDGGPWPDAAEAAAGGLLLDAAQWSASLGGQALQLTRKEFELLHTLARNPGRILSRARLLELAYADDLDASERAIDSHIKNLRRKLAGAAAGHEWIRSVYGVGFVFEAPL